MGEDEHTFLEIGDGLLKTGKMLSGFNPKAAIVDIGSGYRCLAYALLRSGFAGTYHGLEILKPRSDWTQQNLSSGSSKVLHFDIRNARYNPEGETPRVFGKVRRHYPDERDYAHVRGEIENYITSFADMLQPGGKVVCTFFQLNAERRHAISEEKSKLSFPFILSPVARYHTTSDPLLAIAFELERVETLVRRRGLVVESISYGHWCDGQPKIGQQFQDFVILGQAAGAEES